VEKLLKFVTSSLVSDPDQIRIETEESGRERTFTLLLPQEELGRLIGRHGKTAEALRTVLSAMGQRDDLKVNLRIRELD
jgi:predicted RNA-binding protein YlqC (UPF0109 family)